MITAAPANKTTGSNAERILFAKLGISSSDILLLLNKEVSGVGLYFFNVWANTGPPNMIAGIATIRPYSNVSPISAP